MAAPVGCALMEQPFRVTGYTSRLRAATAAQVLRQSTAESYPEMGSSAIYRRAFYCSLFNIFKAEAVEEVAALIAVSFPQLQLPLIKVELNDETWKCIMETIGYSMELLKRKLVMFLEAPFDQFWSQLFVMFLRFPPAIPWGQFNLKMLHSRYPRFLLDHVAVVDGLPWSVPILLCEVSRIPLYHEDLAHKDEDKLAVCMGAAMLRWVTLCQHLGEAFLTKLVVFGMLIGATDFQVCALYLDFGKGELRGPGQPIRPFTKIFRSSRKSWRFRLVGKNYAYMTHSTENAFNCQGQDIVIKPAAEPEDFETVNSAAEDYLSGFIPEAEGVEPNENDQIRDWLPGLKTFNQIEEEIRTTFMTDNMNEHGVRVFYRLMKLIEAEAARILKSLIAKPPPTNPKPDTFDYPDNRVGLMFKGRMHSNTSSTIASTPPPKRSRIIDIANMTGNTPTTQRPGQPPNAEASLPPGRESPPSSPEMQGISVNDPGKMQEEYRPRERVAVTKRFYELEVDVYRKEAIRSSRLFPKMFDHYCDPAQGQDTVTLVLEKVIPLRNLYLHFPKMLDTFCGAQFMTARLILDIMGAIRILHSTGIVHRDISPNNIGFNTAVGTWQLFDFDRSLPIDVAATVPHRSGTPRYRSCRFETSGLFRTRDDYISLLRIVNSGIGFYHPGMLVPFEKFMTSVVGKTEITTEEVKTIYSSFLSVYRELFELHHWTPIENDPSYQEAQKILALE